MNTRKPCHVGIVGGSIAGNVTAFLLASRGIKVTLINQEKTGKVCGEGLSVLGYDYLKNYGLLELEDSQLNPFYGFKVNLAGGSSFAMRGKVKGYGIKREIAESNLLIKIKPLLTDYINAKADEITQQAVYVTGQELKFDYVVDARGYRRVTASQVEPQSGKTGFIMRLNGTWQTPAELVSIWHEPYLVVATPMPDCLNLSFFLKNHAGWDKQAICEHGLKLASDLGFRVNDYQAAGIPLNEYYQLKLCSPHDGIYRVGDSLSRLNPIGGMGMTHAIFSAEKVALKLIDTINKKNYQGPSIHTLTYRKGLKILRLLTNLSADLNCKRNQLTTTIVRILPKFGDSAFQTIEACFPKSTFQ